MMNVQEFINHQRTIWGEDYVDDLINGNYAPTLTSAGWRWVYVSDTDYSSHVDRIAALDSTV